MSGVSGYFDRQRSEEPRPRVFFRDTDPAPTIDVMRSHEIRTDDPLLADVHRAVDTVMAKLKLEDERLRRLLPVPPEGFRWTGELRAEEDADDRYWALSGVVRFRLVYRLIGE